MTLKELWSLNRKLDWEISKRLWWVYVILIVGYIGFYIYNTKRKKWKRGK